MARDEKEEEMQKTILLLQEELCRLKEPPYIAGTVLRLGEKTVQLVTDNGSFHEVAIPSKKGLSAKFREKLQPGSKVILNGAGAM